MSATLQPMGLTHRQSAVLAFVEGYILAKGASPTYEEIREHMGLKSKSSTHRLVSQLVERGFLVRTPHKTCSLTMPNDGALALDACRKIVALGNAYCSHDVTRLRNIIIQMRDLAIEGLKHENHRGSYHRGGVIRPDPYLVGSNPPSYIAVAHPAANAGDE